LADFSENRGPLRPHYVLAATSQIDVLPTVSTVEAKTNLLSTSLGGWDLLIKR
jgi:hypothetical protein